MGFLLDPLGLEVEPPVVEVEGGAIKSMWPRSAEEVLHGAMSDRPR